MPICTRWVDINNGDPRNFQHRSILVVQYTERGKREELASATHLCEAIPMLIYPAISQAKRDLAPRQRELVLFRCPPCICSCNCTQDAQGEAFVRVQCRTRHMRNIKKSVVWKSGWRTIVGGFVHEVHGDHWVRQG